MAKYAPTLKNTPDNCTYVATFIRNYHYKIELTCADGYKWDKAPTLSYNNNYGEATVKTINLDGDSKRAYYDDLPYDDDDASNGLTITSGSVVSDTTELTVKNNVPNTTVQAVQSGTTVTVNLTCADGYKFATYPYFEYTDEYGDLIKKALDMNADRDTGYLQFDGSDIDFDFDLYVEGTTEKKKTTTLNIVNTVANTNATYDYDGTTANIQVTGELEKKRFTDARISYIDSLGDAVTVSMTVSTDGKSVSVVLTDVDPDYDLTVYGNYVLVVQVNKSLTNCKTETDLPEYFTQGADVKCKLLPLSGDEFTTDNVPFFQYADEVGEIVKQYFTVSEDGQSAEIDFTLPTDYELDFIYLYAVATEQKEVGTNYGSIYVYKVTNDILTEFAQKRFFKQEMVEGSLQYESIDLGNWVNSVKRLFVNVPDGVNTVIRCGNYNTEIQTNQPESDMITVDFGSVAVPSHNNDTTDFESEVKLFVPLYGFVDIPTDYVGEEITLTFKINVVTGHGTALITHGGVLFQTVQINPSQNIIYRTTVEDVQKYGSEDWNETVQYGLEPFIYCKWFESKNTSGRNNTHQTGKIGDFRGFNKFDDIEPVSTPEMLTDEQNDIYTALSNGVYIL